MNTQQQAQQTIQAIQARQAQALSAFKTATDASIKELQVVQQQVQARYDKLSDHILNLDEAPEHLETEHDNLEVLKDDMDELIRLLEEGCNNAEVSFTDVLA